MWIGGFAFVSMFNHSNRNHNPFKGSDGTYIDIKKTFVFSFIFYAISGLIVLREAHSLSSYCDESAPAYTTHDI